ncbi:MAG: TolC family protein [Caulobacterales bacterium]
MKTTIGALLSLACLGLAACATYAPRPLSPDADAALRQPDLRAVARDAASLKHPRLKPLEIDLAKPLTPDEIALIAVIASPDLKAARAGAKVADAQVFQAGLLPDPSITLGFDKLLSGPDMFNGWTAQIAQDLIAFRDRAVTLELQRSAARQVRLDIAWQEWQAAGQARLIAARIVSLGKIAAIDETTRASADEMLQRVLAAAARGDVKADEVETRRIAAADAADKASSAARDLDTARHELNRLLGLKPDTEVAIAAPPPALAPGDAEALFQRARAERLDLQALEAGYDSQEAAVRKAVMDQFNSLQLTVTRVRDTANNQTLGGQVAFALPVWNRGRGGIALAQATRDQLRAEYVARVFTARADIADLVSQLNLEAHARQVVLGQLVPLRRLADEMDAAARRGDIALAVAQAARQSVADKEMLLATLDQAIGEQTAALQIAVGGPLADD